MKKHLILALILVFVAGSLMACGGDDGNGGGASDGYTDGTYAGEADGFHGPVKVSVEIKDGKIASVEVTEHDETAGVSDDAIAEVPVRIVSSNSADVDIESGATVTSEAIMEAVADALANAK